MVSVLFILLQSPSQFVEVGRSSWIVGILGQFHFDRFFCEIVVLGVVDFLGLDLFDFLIDDFL